VFRNASPAQQEELLALASRQGLVYAHQLPTNNGAQPHAAPPDDPRCLNLFSRLLQGQTGDLQPIRPRLVPVFDTGLDERQREAVARALASPDICLIQGLPGTGKSRVVAEIVSQAAARGDRVLLAAPAAAAVDRVLEFASVRDVLCPIRCVAPGERPEDLPPAARAATLAERVRSLRAHALGQAVRAREQAERRCRRLQEEEAVWPRLQEIAERERALSAEGDTLAARRQRIPAEASAEAETAPDSTGLAAAVGTVAAAYQEALARAEDGIARCDRERAESARAVEELTAQAEALRSLAEAKRRGRWWSPAWWRATFKGDAPAKLAAVEARRDAARAALDKVDQERAVLDRQRTAAEETFQAEKGRLIEAETARRLADLDQQTAALRARRDALTAEWDAACVTLEHASLRPAQLSAEAIAAAQARWQTRWQEDEAHCAFARQWSAYLEQCGSEPFATRLPGYANLVAATTAALATDEHFGDAAAAGGSFDLLVLEEADLATDSELLKLARRARRWVLVGEAPPPESVAATPRHRGHYRGPALPAGPARAQAFHRLWQTLHCDPARLPYAWAREGERLCCRLRQLPPEQRQWLESERVADCLDIELRILASPRVRPLLTEVIFPGSMTVAQAKEYIYRELQELPVLAAERSLRWVEEPERLLLVLSDVGSAEVESVALEAGVRELIVAAADGPACTCRLEFDRQAGWDRARAEQWVEGHLRLRDLGRSARLEIAYRMAPELCEIVSDVLFDGTCGVPPVAAGAPKAPAVDFVAVPPLSRKGEPVHAGRERDRRRREQTAVATRSEPRTQQATFPRAGAGLEQDLSATGYSDRLPADLRARLPRRGVVNYQEAQAVVRWLEEFAATRPAEAAEVAVVALYQAQAELIRLLIQQSAALAAGGPRVEVDEPAAFRQREFAVVLVSLTRSHGHRAVSFGEEPRQLALTLTRARTRLVVFGDPGTLARRSQWEGVLDHLDEAAAAREGSVIRGLVGYLEGAGRHARAFRFCEGGST
jgi:hypothetical protein